MANKLDLNLDFLNDKPMEKKEKYCPKCGEKIKTDDTFCSNCGNRLTSEQKNEKPVAENKSKGKDNEKIEYAGFWIRLGAYAIDVLGMIGGDVVVLIVMSVLFGQGVYEWPDIFIGYMGYVVYNTFTLTIWSTSFGKYLYGLKVRTENNEHLNFRQAFKRSLLQPFSTVFFGAGYWNMSKNPKKQAWHDAQTNTVVMRENRNLILAYVATIVGTIIWLSLYSSGK